MFSRIIDLAALSAQEDKNSKKSGKSPTPFSKDSLKKGGAKLSKELLLSSLNALKKQLALQKKEPEAACAMSLADPFSSLIFAKNADGEVEGITGIEPSAQVSELLEKLVDRIVHLHENGISETTFFLDGEAFTSSVFQGSKITITEYSTAPKIFNIQFAGDPKAIHLLEAHAAAMLNALQNGHFGFDVNRIDTSLLTEDEKYALPPVQRDNEKDEEA